MLKLGRNISFPDEAITETFGVLAARGAGKTNTAVVMAEEMFATGLPFVAIDPVGSWWGLRSSKTGKGPGLDLPLFGGKRGDVPLERTGGRLIADLVVDERLSCILDLTQFDSEAAKKQFLLDFARRLYQRNEDPLHLFLEEADDYIPQRPMRDEAQLLRAWENIVRRGRARGLGMTMITQRSASINKNVLTQVQTLIAMRTTGPQDRKAIEDWVKYNDQSRDILEALPSLDNGEAWVWSPQFLKETKRVRFRRRRTFDSGSTPKMAAKSKTATLADVNVDKLREQMADTIKRAEQEDPKILRRRIAALELELKKPGAADENLVSENRKLREDLEVAASRLQESEALRKSQDRQLSDAFTMAQRLCDQLSVEEAPFTSIEPVLPSVRSPAPQRNVARPVSVSTPVDISVDTLNKAQSAILRAFWWLKDENATPDKVSFYSGYSKSGHFTNMLGSLRTAGLIEGWRITEAGQRLMSPIAEPKPTGLELREWLRPKLGKAANEMLDALIASGERMTNEELSGATGYSISGHFTNTLGKLRTLGAAVGYAKDGGVRAADVFFE